MLAGSTLAACATSPQAPIGNDQPITLVEAFRGERTGRGLFSVPLAGVERGFDARLVGTVGGNTLTVVEDFIFDDGEVQQLTWVFTRTGPFEWSGVRDDTVGTATVVETGTDIRLDYVADVVSRGETTRLGFSDIIYREPGNVIINEAVVTRFGIPIGTVRFEIRQT
ncbi:MAG: DUF3833 family protein [Devosiaceae bacterium]|nr:DUF3833 family protein [Devosiaceae bacterium MH13]